MPGGYIWKSEMVQWYHAIFSAYGFWLPNDPRGSWSDFVGSWELFRFGGPATKTNERRSLAHDSHDINFRRDAKELFQFPPVRFNSIQRNAVGRGFARACAESAIIIHACCIAHDHVHIVAQRHEKTIEQVVGQLKGRATQQLKSEGLHPLQSFVDTKGNVPTPWGQHCWRVYIQAYAQLVAAVRYVERHPEKEGLPAQRWEFVTPLQNFER